MSESVESLLREHKVYFTSSGQDYLIKCLNPDHEDTHPSCRVDKITGLVHCFSCGFKHNIFKYYGIFTQNNSIKLKQLKDKLKMLQQTLFGLELPKGATPFNLKFRGISKNTLKHFGAFFTHEEEKLADRIVFPITDIKGNTVVFVGRHTLSDAQPKYIIFPSNAKMPVFPAKLEENTHSVVLVEGIFDMLNLYDKGLTNAVCVFGTGTLKKDTQRKLLPFKVQGVTKIFLMFDGDKAGRAAAKELKPLLEAENYIVEIIDLPDDTDPGTMSEEDVLSMKEYVK